MRKMFLVGLGKINHRIRERFSKEVVGVYDLNEKNIVDIPEIVIDFSNPICIDKSLEIAQTYNIPLIIGTTGYDNDKMALIREKSKIIPIMISANYSYGITLLNMIFKKYKHLLDAFEKVIIECHRKDKLDCPSGTAQMLAYSLGCSDIYSIRKKDVIGQHDVNFYADNEEISISHKAYSRDLFIDGVIMAAEWLCQKNAGLYSFEDCLYDLSEN